MPQPPLDVFEPSGPQARFTGNAVGAETAAIDLAGDNAGVKTYGRIGMDVKSATAGYETGWLTFSALRNGILKKLVEFGRFTGLANDGAALTVHQLSDAGIMIHGYGNPNSPFKVYGMDRVDAGGNPTGGKYIFMLASGENPGMRTNGWVTISGKNGDPVPQEIAGQSSYMLGVSSDGGESPVTVLQTQSGRFFEGYSVNDVLLWSMDKFGVLDLPAYKAAGQAGLTTSVTVGATTLHFTGGLLTAVTP